MSQIINNSIHHTDLYLKAYERSILSLITNRDVKRFADLPQDRKEIEYYEYRNQISKFAVEPVFIRNPDIASIYIISFNGNSVYFYNQATLPTFSTEAVMAQLDYLLQNTSPDGSLNILNYSILDEQMKNQTIRKFNMLTLVRQIHGQSSLEPQAVVAIEFRSNDLSALWKGIDLGENGYFFITNAHGEIIYHTQSERVGDTILDSLGTKIANANLSTFENNEDGVHRMYMARKSNYSDWNLVVSRPVEELRKPVATIRTTTIIVGLLTLVIAMWLAFRFSQSITGPIHTLMRGMRETEKGNWKTIALPVRRDELAELVVRYNLMVNRLSELVEEVYQGELKNQTIQLERQKAEFQSLQLQINPHFLYNTLETIICYAFIKDSEEISEIVQSLSYMLRYSAETHLEEITVVNELKHLMYFLLILRHRIGRDFEIDVAVDVKFLLYKMVRLTLQPLVENVFQHAFREGVEDYHYIRIDGGDCNGTFWISVEDNGAGMSEQKLKELRGKLKENRLVDGEKNKDGNKAGIGILNVHRRIQMVFGEQYGLRIESKADQGTKMIMVMPASIHAESEPWKLAEGEGRGPADLWADEAWSRFKANFDRAVKK